MPHNQSTTKGFSLVELSIVLVILGLLVGGVLAGQSLIKAAQLRSVTTEYSRYVTAVASFRDKYFALPGDMTNAQSFWGITPVCPGTSASPSTGTQTCNGDGDGRITWNNAPASNETYRFWQHLANAGLIEGSYNGVDGTAVGTNFPVSKFSNAGWAIIWYGEVLANSSTTFEGSYGNPFLFGTAASVGTSAILRPEEAWNIDTKLDDGKPATGRVVTWETDGSGSCSDLASSTTASLAASVYQLSNNAFAVCRFIMKNP